MKKRFGFFAVVLSIEMMLMGCMSMVPVSDNGSFPADSQTYTVLGRVEVEAAAQKSGYEKLYAAAVEQYPDADDVVNVKIDEKRTTLLFIFTFYRYNMSGIAIKYN